MLVKAAISFTKLSFIFQRNAETDILRCYPRKSFSLEI